MARPVQVGRALIACRGLLVLVTATGCADLPSPRNPAAGCVSIAFAGDARESALAEELRRTLEGGLFFRSLVKRWGSPAACAARIADGNYRFDYWLAGGTVLTAQFTPTIGYSDHRAGLAGTVPTQDAIQLLRENELDRFGAPGCGIEWSSFNDQARMPAGPTILRLRGETCNCQAYFKIDNDAVRTLGFRATC